jgi:hypothetical protein
MIPRFCFDQGGESFWLIISDGFSWDYSHATFGFCGRIRHPLLPSAGFSPKPDRGGRPIPTTFLFPIRSGRECDHDR